MKSKTSITLSETVLEELDKVIGRAENRSVVIERAIEDYLQKLKKAEHYRRELALLDRHAKKLNKEAEDVLSYQADL